MESSPPEMPIFRGVAGGSCSIRLASPAHWIPKISAQRRYRSASALGTNGAADHRTLQPGHLVPEAEGDGPARREVLHAVVEARRRSALGLKPLDIDILRDEAGPPDDRAAVADPARLLEQLAVLGDQAMPAEDQVGCRFRRPRAGIGIRGDATAGLAHHEVGPVAALADRLVARREVEQDVGPGDRLRRTRRDRHPKVFTDLDAHHDAAVGLEEQVDPEGNPLTAEVDLPGLAAIGRAEPATLVKFLVIRDELLGDHPEDLTIRDRRAAVKQAVADRDRHADHDQLRAPARRLGDPEGLPDPRVQQLGLAKQVRARVTRHAELGEQDDVALGHLRQHPDDLVGVGSRVRHRRPRRGTRDSHETKFIHDVAVCRRAAQDGGEISDGPAHPNPIFPKARSPFQGPSLP